MSATITMLLINPNNESLLPVFLHDFVRSQDLCLDIAYFGPPPIIASLCQPRNLYPVTNPYLFPKRFNSEILHIVKKKKYHCILPCDEETFILSKIKSELDEHTSFLYKEFDLIKQLICKQTMQKLLIENGLPCLPAVEYDRSRPIPQELSYPLLLKKSITSGGSGQKIIYSAAELPIDLDSAEKYLLQPYIENSRIINASGICHDGDCARVLLYQDMKFMHNVCTGERHIKHAGIEALFKELCAKIAFSGPISVDFLVSENTFYIIDINPRIDGGVGGFAHCGVPYLEEIFHYLEIDYQKIEISKQDNRPIQWLRFTEAIRGFLSISGLKKKFDYCKTVSKHAVFYLSAYINTPYLRIRYFFYLLRFFIYNHIRKSPISICEKTLKKLVE